MNTPSPCDTTHADARSRRRGPDAAGRPAGPAKPLTPKERMAIPPQAMPSQDPAVRRATCRRWRWATPPSRPRRGDALPAVQERALRQGLPGGIDIPGFVTAAAEGDFDDAIAIIKANSLLPAVCGRVCPQETQCQAPLHRGQGAEERGQGRLHRPHRALRGRPGSARAACSARPSSRRPAGRWPSSAAGRPASPSPPTCGARAMRSRCSRRSTSPAAC
jgi:hypothetical protein